MSTTSKKSKYNVQTSNLVYFDPYSISVIKDRINFERNRQKLLLINQYTGWHHDPLIFVDPIKRSKYFLNIGLR